MSPAEKLSPAKGYNPLKTRAILAKERRLSGRLVFVVAGERRNERAETRDVVPLKTRTMCSSTAATPGSTR
jgi:hypothetical protein